MNFKLRVWRQNNPESKGKLVDYEAADISPNTSFLEMLDTVNEQVLLRGEIPIAFDSDCREGICGTCSLTINGEAHGKDHPGAVCELYMRRFRDGETIIVEPFRLKAFPIIKDLVVDRSALDRIVQAGGFISARAGSAPEANSIPVSKHNADLAMEAAACIGCGACAAACPNASAMLFTGAKVSHLAFLPQGHPERTRRVLAMVRAMDEEGFGNCSNIYECVAVCPADIPGSVMAKMYREYATATLRDRAGE
ncbi:MAG: succinate dehydrogenase/fumarate reductase iron-sulfur subunit [Chthoniobacterales bacterium]|nr:MAG: succinate dehydrogenase/fumarate reductase iron-sulfur subunit [Chthoniobacterales bacterium]